MKFKLEVDEKLVAQDFLKFSAVVLKYNRHTRRYVYRLVKRFDASAQYVRLDPQELRTVEQLLKAGLNALENNLPKDQEAYQKFSSERRPRLESVLTKLGGKNV